MSPLRSQQAGDDRANLHHSAGVAGMRCYLRYLGLLVALAVSGVAHRAAAQNPCPRDSLKLKGMGGAAAFSPDGKTVAVRDGANVVLWDVTAEEKTVTLDGDLKEITRLVFSPDGKSVAAGNIEGVVKVWDVARARTTYTL